MLKLMSPLTNIMDQYVEDVIDLEVPLVLGLVIQGIRSQHRHPKDALKAILRLNLRRKPNKRYIINGKKETPKIVLIRN